MNFTPHHSQFATTRWTHVLQAIGDTPVAKQALSDLCEMYYHPVHEFIRHQSPGLPGSDARDLTHAFFARLLEKPGFDSLEKGRGRFRSYLLGAVKHFLSDQRKYHNAQKRDGGELVTDAEPEVSYPDSRFDRAWAVNQLDLAISQLAEEHQKAGKTELFEVIKPWLNGNVAPISQSEAAEKLSMTEGAVKVAIHRLRKRFRELVKQQIRETVETDEEVSIELNYLIEVLQTSS